MSAVLLEFAKSFASGRLTAMEFAGAFIELWKIEGRLGLLQQDEAKRGEVLSEIYCLADLYCGIDEDRLEYELNEQQLLVKVSAACASMETKDDDI